MNNVTYCKISEDAARRAKEMNSFTYGITEKSREPLTVPAQPNIVL